MVSKSAMPETLDVLRREPKVVDDRSGSRSEAFEGAETVVCVDAQQVG